MKKIKIYLDTSVPNFLFADDAPEKKEADAFHAAITLIKQFHFLVSWNYKHLANVNKESKIRLVNIENNYLHEFRIITPLELIYYEN